MTVPAGPPLLLTPTKCTFHQRRSRGPATFGPRLLTNSMSAVDGIRHHRKVLRSGGARCGQAYSFAAEACREWQERLHPTRSVVHARGGRFEGYRVGRAGSVGLMGLRSYCFAAVKMRRYWRGRVSSSVSRWRGRSRASGWFPRPADCGCRPACFGPADTCCNGRPAESGRFAPSGR